MNESKVGVIVMPTAEGRKKKRKKIIAGGRGYFDPPNLQISSS